MRHLEPGDSVLFLERPTEKDFISLGNAEVFFDSISRYPCTGYVFVITSDEVNIHVASQGSHKFTFPARFRNKGLRMYRFLDLITL